MNEIIEIETRKNNKPREPLTRLPYDGQKLSTIISKAAAKNAVPKSRNSILWSKIRFYVGISGVILYISIAIIVGVLVVCLTSPETQIGTCPLRYKTIITNSTEYHSNPRSIALGDFNNDDILDIAVANFAADNIRIFISLGRGKFLNQKTYSTGKDSHPNSIALDDINNDTHLDIVVSTYGNHSIQIFLGNGNGTIRYKTQYPTGSSRPFFITIADLNNDQQLDIIIANYGTDNIAIRFGQDNEIFSKPIIYSTGYDSLPYSIAIADLNSDNQQDIIVANHGTHNICIFFGLKNNTFTNPIIYSTGLGSYPTSIAIGDFNNDNQLDIAVSNDGTNGISILYGYGNGSFILGTSFAIGYNSQPCSLAIGDFNNDNVSDIVVTNCEANNILGLFQNFVNLVFLLYL